MYDFITKLSSKDPVPGGGGASALIGAISAALCSMVANLTNGKKKYAEYQADIEEILARLSESIPTLMTLIEKDAEVFEPLAEAYSSKNDVLLENALVTACSVPMEILKESANLIDVIEQLAVKGSKLAVSDVGVAASACRCAMESAVMNIYINTKMMKNIDYAKQINAEAEQILAAGISRCNIIYNQITEDLKCSF